MVCSNCGNQIKEGEKFCMVCGSPVSSVGQYNQMNYEQPQNVEQNAYQQQQNIQQNIYGQPQNTQQNNAYGQSQFGQQNAYGQPQYGQQNTYQQQQNTQQNAYGQQQNTYGQQQYTQQNAYQQSQYGQQNNAYQRLMQQNTYAAPVNNTALGMKWFKFIIWVQLFLNAILNVRQGIIALTGAHYDGAADRVYRIYENLKIYDTIYGVAVILLAVFAIWTRFKLSEFKKDGPVMYFIFLGANIIIPLIYVIFVAGELSASVGEVLSNGPGTTIIGCLVMLIANIVYFKNRKHLFVN